MMVRRSCPGTTSVGLDHADAERLIAVLFANHGDALLSDREARMAYLRGLEHATLRRLAAAAGLDAEQKPVDLAVSIGGLPWRVGSALPAAFAEVLAVPARYLPDRADTVSVINRVVPAASIPRLFDFQEGLKTRVLDWLGSSVSGAGGAALLQLPTGSGKTRTALEAIIEAWSGWLQVDQAGGVLWLAHSEELCEQAAETFERLWVSIGTIPLDVVRFWGRSSIRGYELTNSFVVAGFSKMSALRRSDQKLYQHLLKISNVCVVDEAHRALAPTVQQVINDFRARDGTAVLGLTATPGRSKSEDQENRMLARLFDNHLIAAEDLGPEPVSELQKRGILAVVARREIYSGVRLPRDVDSQSGDVTAKTLDRLAKDPDRNRLIVETILDLAREGRSALVFACTVDHARELAARSAIAGLRSGAIDCRMNIAARRSLVDQFRSGSIEVLFNYGVLTTGFDAPSIGAIVIGRPTTSIVLYSQMVGRALRGPEVGGTSDCVVVDIRDNYQAFGDLDAVYNYFDGYWA